VHRCSQKSLTNRSTRHTYSPLGSSLVQGESQRPSSRSYEQNEALSSPATSPPINALIEITPIRYTAHLWSAYSAGRVRSGASITVKYISYGDQGSEGASSSPATKLRIYSLRVTACGRWSAISGIGRYSYKGELSAGFALRGAG